MVDDHQIYRRHKTPVSRLGSTMDLRVYLSGYADGEGCFCVTFNRSKRHALGWDIRPSFSVSQNRERAQILELFQQSLGCGTIRPDRSDRTLKFEVRSVPDLASAVIPHFRRYPMLSMKQRDFEIFAKVCEMMSRGEHLTTDGFSQIAVMASEINRTGNKEVPQDRDKGIVYALW